MNVFENSVAVITGGASGIGRALALAAAARRMKVAIADVEVGRAQGVADEVARLGGDARAFGCDVSDAAQVLALAADTRKAFGGAHFLFNNAGVAAAGGVEMTSVADATWLLSVNVMGVFHGIKAFLPLLREARATGKPAHIINTGSENSVGLPVMGPNSLYTATKHAVLGLSDALRRDLEETGIAVSLLCPGLVNTKIYDAARNRPVNHGGPIRVPAQHVERILEIMEQKAQDPALTAELCFEGIERKDFIIITDPAIRNFVVKRHREVEAALDLIDQRLA